MEAVDVAYVRESQTPERLGYEADGLAETTAERLGYEADGQADGPAETTGEACEGVEGGERVEAGLVEAGHYYDDRWVWQQQ